MRRKSTDRQAIDILRNYFGKICFADRDGDLDMDPLTNAAWEAAAFSNGATGTINWNALFGVPLKARAVFLWVAARDSASAGGSYAFNLRARATTSDPSLTCRCPRAVNDEPAHQHGWVPIAAAGTSYYNITASGANTMDVWVRVVAYVI